MPESFLRDTHKLVGTDGTPPERDFYVALQSDPQWSDSEST